MGPWNWNDCPKTLKYWVGVQQGQFYLMGEGASLALVGRPSSDGVMIKMPYGVDVFIDQLCTPSFPIGLVKTESGFIVRSVETGLGRWTLWLMLMLIFFVFLRLDLSPWGYGNRCFLVALCRLIVRRPNLEPATKRLLHQQVKILG